MRASSPPRRPGRPRPGAAQRRHLRRQRASSVAHERRAADHQLQPGLPRATPTASASSSTSGGTWTRLSGPRTAGHTGYTGTSIVIDFASRSFAILLTNRVHPSRGLGQQQPRPRGWRRGTGPGPGGRARATAPTAWFSGTRDATTATLTTRAAGRAGGGASLSSTCSSTPRPPTRSPWSPRATAAPPGRALPFRLRDRGRPDHGADGAVAEQRQPSLAAGDGRLDPGAVQVRWRYTTDALYPGRGVFVDGVRVAAARRAPVARRRATPGATSSRKGGARCGADVVG